MIDGVLIFICVFGLGVYVGARLAWHRFCRTERPKLEIKITPEVASTISQQMVMAWLNERGLVWMPKGVDFKAKVKR